MEKICLNCKNVFETHQKNKQYCNKKDCLIVHKKNYYNSRFVDKICSHCDKLHKNLAKKKYCSVTCADLGDKKEIKQTIQIILCFRCSEIMGVEDVTLNHRNKGTLQLERIGTSLCYGCTENSRKRRSDSKKGVLNPNWKGGHKKRKRRYTPEQISERMKKHNPMHCQEVKDKVCQTLKEKYSRGLIKRKIGPESVLYRGNRKRSFTLRTHLTWWRKENLSRANYTCGICLKVGGRLEVHHEPPLREIVNILLPEGINSLDDFGESDFLEFSRVVSEEHRKPYIKGIVVCKGCHATIDAYRKLKDN